MVNRTCHINRLASFLLDTDSGALVLLERSHVLGLLFEGLEATVSDLRGGIDELELDLLEILSLVVNKERLSEKNRSLSDAHATALDHDKVVLDLAVMREAADRVDRFDGDIRGGATVVDVELSVLGLVAGADSVDLLVDLYTVMVALLASASHGEADSRRMPRTDTGDLSETTMRLSRKLLGAPSAGYTLSAVTLSDTNAVGVVVLSEDVGHRDLLFEKSSGEVDLVTGVATVDLELDDMSLLLLQRQKLHLSMSNKSYDTAVLFDLGEGGFLALLVCGPLLLVLAEGLLLAGAPVLVEASSRLVADMLSPDGFEGSETARRLDVADDANANHWRRVDDGDGLDDFLLVELGSLAGDFTDDVRHAGLVANESGEVALLGLVVLRVGLEAAEMATATLSREESLGTVSRCFEFSMRHVRSFCKFDLRL